MIRVSRRWPWLVSGSPGKRRLGAGGLGLESGFTSSTGKRFLPLFLASFVNPKLAPVLVREQP